MKNNHLPTLSELIIDANNNSDDLGYLSDLFNEFIKNRKKYPIVQVKYAVEHFQNLAKQMARRDAALIKEYFAGSGVFD